MTRKTKTEELADMSRRRFTKTLAGLGLSTAVVNNMTQEALAEQTEDPTKEVPRQLARQVKNPEKWKDKPADPNDRPEMENVWYTIPRSQWVRVETAQSACQRLQKRMNKLDSSCLAVGVKSESNTSKSEKRLDIEYTTYERKNEDGEWEEYDRPDVSFERVEEEAPYTVTGVVGEGDNREKRDVEVNITRRTARESSHCDTSGSGHYDYFYEGNYPAGASLETCTSLAPAYHYSHGYVGTTAGHCYEAFDEVWQPTDGSSEEKCGMIQREEYWKEDSSPQRTDIAMLTFSSHRDAYYYLAANTGDSDYDEYLAGMMSWSAIADMEDTNETMYRQGGRTGRCQGNVVGAYGGYSVRNFDTDAYEMNGDSGGPHFMINDDGSAYIAGGHWGGPTSSTSRGIFIRDIYDRFSLEFR